MRAELKEFLREHKNLIIEEKYYELYIEVRNYFHKYTYCTELTEFLHSCELDPLQYMPTIPAGFMATDDSIDHVVIPDNIELVEQAAFVCSDIQSVSFSDTSRCDMIVDRAFQSCVELKNVILPPSLTNICYMAFEGCTKLESVVIPTTSAINFSATAFDNCPYVTIYCNPGPVEQYCVDNNISHKLISVRGGSK